LIEDGISIYTDGSKSENFSVGAAIYSPELGFALKHKPPADSSIFSAETWAVYQALILLESSNYYKATIFSDCRSVLDALTSHQKKSKSYTNYLIPLSRSKFQALCNLGYSIKLA